MRRKCCNQTWITHLVLCVTTHQLTEYQRPTGHDKQKKESEIMFQVRIERQAIISPNIIILITRIRCNQTTSAPTFLLAN